MKMIEENDDISQLSCKQMPTYNIVSDHYQKELKLTVQTNNNYTTCTSFLLLIGVVCILINSGILQNSIASHRVYSKYLSFLMDLLILIITVRSRHSN